MEQPERGAAAKGEEITVHVHVEGHQARDLGEGKEHAAVAAPEVEDHEIRPRHQVREITPEERDGAFPFRVAGKREVQAALREVALPEGVAGGGRCGERGSGDALETLAGGGQDHLIRRFQLRPVEWYSAYYPSRPPPRPTSRPQAS